MGGTGSVDGDNTSAGDISFLLNEIRLQILNEASSYRKQRQRLPFANECSLPASLSTCGEHGQGYWIVPMECPCGRLRYLAVIS